MEKIGLFQPYETANGVNAVTNADINTVINKSNLGLIFCVNTPAGSSVKI